MAHLADELGALVHRLSAHCAAESPAFLRLPPAEERVLRRGQARVGAEAETLRRDALASCPGPSTRCAVRAEELLALLGLQAHDERLAFRRVSWGTADRDLRR